MPLPKYLNSEWSYAQYRIPSQSAHISLSAGPSKPPTADVVDEEKCVVGWIQGPVDDSEEPNRPTAQEYQLIALTWTGGWYRLSVPNAGPIAPAVPGSPTLAGHRPRSSSGSSVLSRPDKGKGREREKDSKESRECILREFRRYGRWDGWG